MTSRMTVMSMILTAIIIIIIVIVTTSNNEDDTGGGKSDAFAFDPGSSRKEEARSGTEWNSVVFCSCH